MRTTTIATLATALGLSLGLSGCADSGVYQVGQTQQSVEVCALSETTFGIDVSRFQGNINWSQVAGAGVKFAYIQISRKINDIDAKFEFNWEQAKQNGILRGAYQRFQPDQDVQAQANIFLSKLGPFQAGDLPPMLDVEDSGNLPASTIAERVRQWLNIVEGATGVRPIIYTGRYFWQDFLNSADFTEYPLWIAHYTTGCPNIPAPWTNWAIHQYSSTAVIAGITANTVDVNHFNGSIDDLLALAGGVCGDGVCNGGESTSSCEADCPPCQVISEEGDTVDESGACFHGGGDPAYLRRESVGIGDSLIWTHATDLAQPSNYGEWQLYFAKAGTYKLEASTPQPFGMSKQAAYQIRHGEGATTVEIDQSAVDGWSVLGEFSFAQGGDQSIRLDDNTGEANDSDTKIVFDAIRLTRLDLPEEDADEQPGDDEDTEAAPDEGGCSSAGRPVSSWNGSLFTLLALCGMGWRRRRGRQH